MIDESQAYIDKDGRLFQVNNGRKFYLDKFQAENTAVISKTKNLPFDDQAEEHRLKDNTVYKFDGIVTSDYPIILGSTTPLVGNHGSVDGFIHTGGGGVAIKGSDAGLFMRDLYVHAPFGTIFDITGGVDTEVLVESVSFSDAAGIGNIASLGTIDGMRVPSFKGCNFENFNEGLTFTGDSTVPDKVFIEGCPLRGVDNSGVTILKFDGVISPGVVDIVNCYVKGVQSDTEVIRVRSGATPSEIFQYRGNTHDNTVTKSNILTGAAGVEEIGYRVKDSFPLIDSAAIANYSLDSNSTVSISSQATSKTDASAYETVPGTTTSNVAIRWNLGDNNATYKGRKDTQTQLSSTLSVGTSSGDTVVIAWFRNGNIVNGTPTRVQTQGTGNAVGQSITSVGICPDCQTDDTYDIRVANLDSTDDIQVGEMNASLDAEV